MNTDSGFDKKDKRIIDNGENEALSDKEIINEVNRIFAPRAKSTKLKIRAINIYCMVVSLYLSSIYFDKAVAISISIGIIAVTLILNKIEDKLSVLTYGERKRYYRIYLWYNLTVILCIFLMGIDQFIQLCMGVLAVTILITCMKLLEFYVSLPEARL